MDVYMKNAAMGVLQSDYHFARDLSSQPDEIILAVAAYLSFKELNAWMQTSRRFFQTLSSTFYSSAFGTDINRQNAITWAAKHGNVLCMKKVLEYAPSDYLRGAEGYRALNEAIQSHQEDVVRFILGSGIKFGCWEKTSSEILSAVDLALRYGNTAIVMMLLDAGHGCFIEYILCHAAKHGHVAIVRALIKRGVNVNLQCEGFTPLHRAVFYGRIEVVILLLEAGANIYYADELGDTLLIRALDDGNLKMAELLLFQAGARATVTNYYGATPLHYAARHGFVSIARSLLEKGANVNATSVNGYTPLLLAINSRKRTLEMIQLLLGAGADYALHGGPRGFPSPPDFDGEPYHQSPLMCAMTNKDHGTIQLLLDAGAVPDESEYTSKMLLWSTINRQLDIVRLLLKHEVGLTPCPEEDHVLDHIATSGLEDILALFLETPYTLNEIKKERYRVLCSAANRGGKGSLDLLLNPSYGIGFSEIGFHSALTIAAWHGNSDIVFLLLQRTTGVDIQDREGCTVLHHAVNGKNCEVVRMILEKSTTFDLADSTGTTPLLLAASNSSFEIAKMLLDKGADVDSRDENDDTALHLAMHNDNKRLIEILLKRNANIEARDRDTFTPLLFAICKDKHIALLLLNRGVEFEPRRLDAYTPLLIAIRRREHEIVKVLIEKGANINVQDIEQRTPLSWAAAQHSDTEIVGLLIDKGADIDHPDINGQTPLMLALSKERHDTVRYLLSKSANVNCVDSSHWTALFHAVKKWCVKGLKLLIEHGADINLPDNTGRTPLSYAVENASVSIVKTLIRAGADVAKGDKDGKTPLSWALERGLDSMVKLIYDRTGITWEDD